MNGTRIPLAAADDAFCLGNNHQGVEEKSAMWKSGAEGLVHSSLAEHCRPVMRAATDSNGSLLYEACSVRPSSVARNCSLKEYLLLEFHRK